MLLRKHLDAAQSAMTGVLAALPPVQKPAAALGRVDLYL